MRRRKYKHIWRRIEKTVIRFMLLSIGVAIIAFIVLPKSVWLILTGLAMICIGYKLFCHY
ncbi:hypothetical protein [Marinisporobacter balticus]|uniref:hypothetical protein n=1 Tax=Marinisporobacter balticus TaxID=2018667 RepID=UPI00104E39B2|nr:hypothetical protein [Marinisporobacter balticus]